jgi:hypothetical protein
MTMTANEVIKQVMEEVLHQADGDEKFVEGFMFEAKEVQSLIDSDKDSTEIIAHIVSESFIHFNRAEDLKEEDGDFEEIRYREGQYAFHENFLELFKKWLVHQDYDTIVKHSVNEILNVKDSVNIKFDTFEERFFFRLTEFRLKGYRADENGEITEVDVEINGIGNKKVKTFSYDDFKKLFEIDYIEYLRENMYSKEA